MCSFGATGRTTPLLARRRSREVRCICAAYDERVEGFRLYPTSYIFGEELGIGS